MAVEPAAALCALILESRAYMHLHHDAAGRLCVQPLGCSEHGVLLWRRVVCAAEAALGIEVRGGLFWIDASALPAALRQGSIIMAEARAAKRPAGGTGRRPRAAKRQRDMADLAFHEAAAQSTWVLAAAVLWRDEPKFMFQHAAIAEANYRGRPRADAC